MSEVNKDVVRRYIKDLDTTHLPNPKFFTPDVKITFPGTPPMTLKQYQEASKGFYGAFPDLIHHIEEMIADGDIVAFSQHVTGTHKGTFMGVAATGNAINYSGINWWRLRDGKISEFSGSFDMLTLLKQIGGVKMLTQED
ncbi:MAG: ester cyclase [Chloroflexi bacterium]|nr:ester cyclase [Chloroflexota bacterium]